MKPLRHCLVATIAAITTAQWGVAGSADRQPVTDIKPLLILAIDQGSAQGVLVGESANYLRQKFDANTPIDIDVRRLNELPQAGCSRLDVTTRQTDVLEKGTRCDKVLSYQVSYCRDGRFPGKQ